MEAQALSHSEWSAWRETRHISNEPELLERLRKELTQVCQDGKCRFSDLEDEPERWGVGEEGELREVRFGVVDPVAHALDTQIDLVGHTTILVGLHGGALGLSLFLPPGPSASIIEVQSSNVVGNYHFSTMAVEMGHHYTLVETGKEVNLDNIWTAVKDRVTHDF